MRRFQREKVEDKFEEHSCGGMEKSLRKYEIKEFNYLGSAVSVSGKMDECGGMDEEKLELPVEMKISLHRCQSLDDKGNYRHITII